MLIGTTLVVGSTLVVRSTDTADAHTCVGDWRAAQWEAALEELPHVWEPNPHYAGLPTCVLPVPVVSLDITVPPATADIPPPFMPAVERWRPLVAAHFPAHAIQDALTVMSRESGGCPTAAAYNGCVGHYLERQNTTGCQARGLFQHCARYWQHRTEQYGFAPHCLPPAMTVDPACNVALAHALWLDSGCSFWPHWEQTDHGTQRGCKR